MRTSEEELKEQQKKAIEQLEEWDKGNYFDVYDKRFKFYDFTHTERITIYAFYSQIESALMLGNFGFLEDPKFKTAFALIEKNTTFEDMAINKIPDFWEKNAEYYLDFVSISFKAISYALVKKKLTMSLKDNL